MCTSTGNQRFGVVTKARRDDAQSLVDEAALLHPAADVLDHRIREADVELGVVERQRERVALDVPRPRDSAPGSAPLVQAERRDLLGPWIQLLEEVRVPQPGRRSPKPKSSTPMSSTVVDSVGVIVSMKRPNLRRRERSEIAVGEAHRHQE